MTPNRFAELLQAYGSDPQHWPAAERDAALAFVTQQQATLAQPLAEADALDQWLSTHTVTPADDALFARIVAEAHARVQPPRTAQLWPHGPRWIPSWIWPGAGWAGVGLAGTFAGVMLVSAAVPDSIAPAVDAGGRGTAFTELYADWSSE